MSRYRAHKPDGNQDAIVKSLRQIPGVKVLVLSQVGKGCPDILIGYKGRNWLFEIKDPSQDKSTRVLTKDEAAFFFGWSGQANVVETLADILKILGVK